MNNLMYNLEGEAVLSRNERAARTLPYLVYGIKVVGRGVPTEPKRTAHRDGSPYLGMQSGRLSTASPSNEQERTMI